MSAGVETNALVSWIDEQVCALWGMKAAVKVLGIATHGWDVDPVGAVTNRKPSEIRTTRIRVVPGVDAPVGNLFGVSQVLSWVASQRREVSDGLEWRSQVQDLIAMLDR